MNKVALEIIIFLFAITITKVNSVSFSCEYRDTYYGETVGTFYTCWSTNTGGLHLQIVTNIILMEGMTQMLLDLSVEVTNILILYHKNC